MIDDFAETVRNILIESDEDISTKYVYHYTSGQALKNIIENDQLWFTERNYMNDVLDEKYIRGIIKKIFSDNNGFKGSVLEDLLLEDRTQYVFSTSLEKDLIHLWSYYSETDSYCLEFDRRGLRDYFLNHLQKDEMLYYGPVIYKRDKQKKIITSVSNNVMNKLNQLFDSPPFTNDTTENMKVARQVYHFFYSLIKQEGHNCEKEFRYLIQSEIIPEFVVKNGIFIPIKKIGKKNEKLPISKIIIGPSNHEKLTMKSLKMFLDKNAYEKVRISKSKLNIRG